MALVSGLRVLLIEGNGYLRPLLGQVLRERFLVVEASSWELAPHRARFLSQAVLAAAPTNRVLREEAVRRLARKSAGMPVFGYSAELATRILNISAGDVRREERIRVFDAIERAVLEAELETPLVSGLTYLRYRPTAPGRRRAELTPRQQSVARLIAAGLSMAEISRRLALSIRTIEDHRAQIMNRLRLRTRDDLVSYLASAPWNDEEPGDG